MQAGGLGTRRGCVHTRARTNTRPRTHKPLETGYRRLGPSSWVAPWEVVVERTIVCGSGD